MRAETGNPRRYLRRLKKDLKNELSFEDETEALALPSGDPVQGAIARLETAVDLRSDDRKRYQPDGTFLAALGGSGSGPGEFAFPAGIAIHADGRVAVIDSLNRRVQVFRLTREDD